MVTIAGMPIDLSGIMPALKQIFAGPSLPDIIAALGKLMGGLLGLVNIFSAAWPGWWQDSFQR